MSCCYILHYRIEVFNIRFFAFFSLGHFRLDIERRIFVLSSTGRNARQFKA